MPRTEIEVVERRLEPLTESEFRALERSHRFLQLLDSGVFSLIRSRAEGFGVRAGPFVGDAVLEDAIRIKAVEKVSGSLRGLLPWSLPDDIRSVETPSLVGTNAVTLELLAKRYLGLLGSYLSSGRLKRYLPKRIETSRPRGRLDVPRTVALRSRGDRDRVGAVVRELSPDIIENRLLAAGLLAAEGATRSSVSLNILARTYAPLMEDVDGWQVAILDQKGRAEMFEEGLDSASAVGDLRRALTFARVLVLHAGAWATTPHHEIPESFFVNLETLFEEAVRVAAADAWVGHEVSKGWTWHRGLFGEDSDRYVADPDIVISNGGESTLLIDTKYKDMEVFPDHADVYQIVAHSEAFGTNAAMLIYPDERPQLSRIGTTLFGTDVHVAKVRPTHLKEDLASLFAEVGPHSDRVSSVASI